MSQIAVDTASVVSEALCAGQGETAVKPSPDPSSVRIKVVADAVRAPAITGAQLTAGDEDSEMLLVSAPGDTSSWIIDIMLSYRRKSRSRMMIGIGTPRSQSRI